MYNQEGEDKSDSHVDDAIGYLTRAIEKDNKNYDCLIGLGKAYEKKGNIDKSIQFTQLAIE